MNKKRVAAVIGLVGMAVCILCIIVSGFAPALKDLLWLVGLVAFLIAASISIFFTLRKKEQEKEPEQEETP